MDGMAGTERFDTVVIGAAQAGLAAGYYLKKARRSFVILDGAERVGDVWRRRYDSLRLFTPVRWIELPGMRFPGRDRYRTATRDEMADYLESYATTLGLPVRTGMQVDRISREGDRYVVAVGGGHRFEADHVVVATGAHRDARVPAFTRDLDPAIVQLHSSEYQNPSQLREGGVLVVGAGNSGGDISLETAGTHPTWLSGPDRGHVPADIDGWIARHLVFRAIRFLFHHVLTIRTSVGRKAMRKLASQGDMLIRVKPKWLAAAGVERVPKTIGVRDGLPLLEDGRVLDVANVIWCTGFRHDLSWIDLPIFGEDGAPLHHRGVATGEPGLYFVGLSFQYAVSSDALPGMARDAEYVVDQIAATGREQRPEDVSLAA
jgi:putative flavoprotein involved in K+ transport